MTNVWTSKTVQIDSMDDLRRSTYAAGIEIVQLQPGRMRGLIRHHTLGDAMVVRRGKFNCGIRTRGSIQPDKVLFMVMLDDVGRFIQWGQEVRAGDIAILPPEAEFNFIFQGSADYVVVALPPGDLPHGDHFGDPDHWKHRRILRVHPPAAASLLRKLHHDLAAMEQTSNPTPQAVDILRRSILESLLSAMASADNNTLSSHSPDLVSRVDDYLRDTDGHEISIAGLISHLHVSRRTLHRVFRAMVGIGPMVYMRFKRLSDVHAILSESGPLATSVSEVAMAHGFKDQSRFSARYHKLFGETPSETLHRARGSLIVWHKTP